MENTFSSLCKKHGCVYATLFNLKGDKLTCELNKNSYVADDKAKKFQNESVKTVFEPNKGIVGRAFSSANYEWQPNVQNLDPTKYFRQGLAKETGMKACVAVPYKSGGKITGVAEFCFTTEGAEKKEFVADAMKQLGN